MARPIRLELPGGWYHVTARSNERCPTFRDDRDRHHFLELLAELPGRFAVALHAYVLMPNHYHRLLETLEANLSRTIQWLNVSYSVWFNRRHQRVGHLLQGRFKAIIVNPDECGFALSRYLHLKLRRYQWSSYRAYIGREKGVAWLERARVYGWLGSRAGPRPQAYQRYVEEAVRQGVEETPWEQLEAGVALGGASLCVGFARSWAGTSGNSRG